MNAEELTEVKDIYNKPIKDGESRFELWEMGKAFGDSVTPSTYDKNYLKQIVDIIESISTPKSKILSIGCGNAFIEKQLVDKGYDLLATDILESALLLAEKKGLKTKKVDATKRLPFSYNSYDLVISDGVIGHLVDKNNSIDIFLKHCTTVLKNKGILFVANDEPLNGKELQLHNNLNVFWVSKKYIEKALRKNGFDNINSTFINYTRPETGIKQRVIIWGSVNK